MTAFLWLVTLLPASFFIASKASWLLNEMKSRPWASSKWKRHLKSWLLGKKQEILWMDSWCWISQSLKTCRKSNRVIWLCQESFQFSNQILSSSPWTSGRLPIALLTVRPYLIEHIFCISLLCLSISSTVISSRKGILFCLSPQKNACIQQVLVLGRIIVFKDIHVLILGKCENAIL